MLDFSSQTLWTILSTYSKYLIESSTLGFKRVGTLHPHSKSREIITVGVPTHLHLKEVFLNALNPSFQLHSSISTEVEVHLSLAINFDYTENPSRLVSASILASCTKARFLLDKKAMVKASYRSFEWVHSSIQRS